MTAFLQQIELFSGLNEADLETFRAAAIVEQHFDGAAILHEGESGEHVYAILNGRADVELVLPGRKTSEIISTLKPGDVFGETTLLGKRRRFASVRARGDVRALKWNADQFNALLGENPAVGAIVLRNLATLLSDRLADTSLTLRNELSSHSACVY